jgi:hypothetical protein
VRNTHDELLLSASGAVGLELEQLLGQWGQRRDLSTGKGGNGTLSGVPASSPMALLSMVAKTPSEAQSEKNLPNAKSSAHGQETEDSTPK